MEESVSPLLREENQRACKEREIALEDKRNNRSDSSDEESHEDDAERRLDRALLREAEAGASKDLNTAVGGDGRPTDPIVKAVLRSLELLDAGVDERGVDEVDLARKLLAKIDSEAHKAEGRKQSVWALECLVAAGLARHTVDRFHYRSARLRAAPTSYAVRRRARRGSDSQNQNLRSRIPSPPRSSPPRGARRRRGRVQAPQQRARRRAQERGASRVGGRRLPALHGDRTPLPRILRI